VIARTLLSNSSSTGPCLVRARPFFFFFLFFALSSCTDSAFVKVMPYEGGHAKECLERGAFLRPDSLKDTNFMELFVFANDVTGQVGVRAICIYVCVCLFLLAWRLPLVRCALYIN